MGKLLEVKEFDEIIMESNYKNDEYKYLEKDAFESLAQFIQEFTSDEDNADILDFMRLNYKRNIGRYIKIKNYVGMIQLKNGYQIQILPKICLGFNEDNKNEKTKEIFIKMLQSMKDFPSKVFHNASLNIKKMNLYEIFINMYLQEVKKLVKRGIKSTYVQQEDKLNYYKGKLLVSQHIKQNIVHAERFYVSYDEYHPNSPENKLVKATLLKLLKITTSNENAKVIKQLLVTFELVDASINYHADLSKVHINRNNREYETLMQWSKVFLFNKSFTTFSGRENGRALLFPMEKVYESYVAKYIKQVMIPEGWSVSIQDNGKYLFEEPQKFSIHPDIVLTKDGKTIIMDTKWKRLHNDQNKNFGITQADMYQMYAYSKKYNASEVWLLYPLNEEMIHYKKDISFKSDDVQVNVHFVDLAHIEGNLEILNKKISE